MTKLSSFIEGLTDKSRLALATAGILAVMVAAPASAGSFFGNSGGRLPVEDIRIARMFNERVTENLRDLVDLSRSIARIDLYGRDRFSGDEKGKKIQIAYLIEFSKSPFPELRDYDKLLIGARRGSQNEGQIARIAEAVNAKKQVLRDGTTLVDMIAESLKYEDYRSVKRYVAQFRTLMERNAVPLLSGRIADNDYSADADYAQQSDEPQVLGFTLR